MRAPSPNAVPRRRDPDHAGFTLVELIVTVTIMTVLLGAAVPVATKLFTYQARSATAEELNSLSEASAAFFFDVERLPTDVAELLVNPGASAPGWTGPYLPGVVADRLTGLTGYQVDAWSRPYSMSAAGDLLTITSMGQDGQLGTSADIAIDLDVTYIRREKTLERLVVINQAVVHYNAQYLSTDPLPPNWAAAFSKLVARGFLPSSQAYQLDAWGQSYVEDPVASSPVVRITSPSLDGTASGSASGNTGGS